MKNVKLKGLRFKTLHNWGKNIIKISCGCHLPKPTSVVIEIMPYLQIFELLPSCEGV